MSIRQGAVAVLCGWEGNRRSGVAMVIHHKLCGISIYGLNGLRKVDEHPAYVPLVVWHPLHCMNDVMDSVPWRNTHSVIQKNI